MRPAAGSLLPVMQKQFCLIVLFTILQACTLQLVLLPPVVE